MKNIITTSLVAFLLLCTNVSQAKDTPFNIETGKQMFKEHLAVIDGVKFKDLRINNYHSTISGNLVVIRVLCGKFSAKNRFGVQLQYTYFFQVENDYMHAVVGETAHGILLYGKFCLNMTDEEAVAAFGDLE